MIEKEYQRREQQSSMNDFVAVLSITTKTAARELIQRGYGHVEPLKVLNQIVEGVDVSKLFYSTSCTASIFYFDKAKLLLLPYYGINMPLSAFDANAEFKKTIAQAEKEAAEGTFAHLLSSLSGRLQSEYLQLLIESDANPMADLYSCFVRICANNSTVSAILTDDDIHKLLLVKSEAQRKRTAEKKEPLPELITVYKGRPREQAESTFFWTRSLKSANCDAASIGCQGGIILKGHLHKTDILEIMDADETVLLATADTVKIEKEINLEGMDFLNEAFRDTDIMEVFQTVSLLLESNIISFKRKNHEHDKLHALRVAFLALLLAKKQGLDKKEMRKLAIAAVLHDAKRENDGPDPAHGKRAVKKCLPELNIQNDDIAFLVEKHCAPDLTESAKKKLPKTLLSELDILKDADALDDVRFGLSAVDIQQLRLNDSRSMTAIARLAFEQLRLAN
jgi:uncharacterized protein